MAGNYCEKNWAESVIYMKRPRDTEDEMKGSKGCDSGKKRVGKRREE